MTKRDNNLNGRKVVDLTIYRAMLYVQKWIHRANECSCSYLKWTVLSSRGLVNCLIVSDLKVPPRSLMFDE